MKWYYLHTIDGKPAHFSEDMIYFSSETSRRPQPLCASLAQIRREQRIDNATRDAQNMNDKSADYGYVRVSLPK